MKKKKKGRKKKIKALEKLKIGNNRNKKTKN